MDDKPAEPESAVQPDKEIDSKMNIDSPVNRSPTIKKEEDVKPVEVEKSPMSRADLTIANIQLDELEVAPQGPMEEEEVKQSSGRVPRLRISASPQVSRVGGL